MAETLLSYYQKHEFNPVPIYVESPDAWESHVAKRRNLYEMHLGIPVSLLRGRSVLEIGCNSGENALVLASYGANLTLVEPNDQVLPRLEALFTQFKLKDRIVSLLQTDLDGFTARRTYDVVLAEGFLASLPDRDLLLGKICGLLKPGGIGIISFGDKYGSLVEMTRRLIFWRACRLNGSCDPESEDSIELAHTLYGDDFAQLAASRPLHAWWKDTIVAPVVNKHTLWSYQEIIPLLEDAGCQFYSSSPKWHLADHYDWYKNVQSPADRHRVLVEDWGRALPFIITGVRAPARKMPFLAPEVPQAITKVVAEISDYTTGQAENVGVPSYPAVLQDYLSEFEDAGLNQFNSDMKRLYEAAANTSRDWLVSTYHDCQFLRKYWGTMYHYVSFIKSPS